MLYAKVLKYLLCSLEQLHANLLLFYSSIYRINCIRFYKLYIHCSSLIVA